MTMNLTKQDAIRKNAAKKQQTASNPYTSSWVTASAGSGKTKVLADRYLRLLLEGINPRVILCITFTKAAAAEMQDRIAKKLQKWATSKNDNDIIDDLLEICEKLPENEAELNVLLNRAKQLFAYMLDAVNDIKIQTIHAFCQHILKRFPLEANIPPHFVVMDDRDSLEIMQKAKNDIFLKAENESNQEILDALETLANLIPEMNFNEIINDVLKNRHQILELYLKHKKLDNFKIALNKTLNIKENETASSIFNDFFKKPANENDLLNAAKILLSGAKTEQKDAQKILSWLASPIETKFSDYDEYKLCFLTKSLEPKKLERSAILKKNPDIKEILYQEAERHLDYKKRCDNLIISQASLSLFAIAKEIILQYEKQKKLKSLLDYDDLISITADLLNKQDTASWVLYKLDNSIDHILIDEAQDTNPSQWTIVEAIISEFFAGVSAKENHRTIFVVGDRKQSIYSFQGADPEGFNKMRELFKEQVINAGKDWNDVALDISFRSTRAVLQAVSETFKSTETRKGVLLENESEVHVPYRIGDAGLVELWSYIEPYENEPPAPWKPPVERISLPSPKTRLATLIAQKISHMINSKEILESKSRPIEPRDIMVLVRRRNDFVDDLVRELKNLNIAVSGVDRMQLCEQIAVMDLLSLMKFLLLPEDDLSLAEVLKSPLIGCSEEELFKLAYNRGKKTLWECLKKFEGDDSRNGDIYEYLKLLLNKADFIRPYELLSLVLNNLKGRKKIVSRLGFEAEDCLNELLNLAITYEHEHIPSLQGFLLWLESGDTTIKRDLEKDINNMVRIMTVHGAKGLQAPIVFLPDTMQMPIKSKQNIFINKDVLLWKPYAACNNDFVDNLVEEKNTKLNEEYKRLLYVAMTRAEDRLYICGYGKYKENSWYDLTKKALKPIAVKENNDFLKNNNIIENSEILKLTCTQEHKVEALESNVVIEFDKNLPSWILEMPEKEPTPARPLAPSRPNIDEPAVFSPLEKGQTNHFLKGNLVHKLLQILPDIEPDKRELSSRIYLKNNAKIFSSDEIEKIIKETFNVINNPDFSVIFNNKSARAEVAVTGLIGKNVISGKIDRLLVTDDEIIIIDYKTSRFPPKNIHDIPPIYLYQMSSYKDALSKIYPNHRIKCGIIWTAVPMIMEIPDNIL